MHQLPFEAEVTNRVAGARRKRGYSVRLCSAGFLLASLLIFLPAQAATRRTPLTRERSNVVAHASPSLNLVTLRHFFSLQCPACRVEEPNVLATYQRFHSQGFAVDAICLDDRATPADLKTWRKDEKICWAITLDRRGWESPRIRAYHVDFLPFSVLLNAKGKVLAINPTGPALGVAVKQALSKP